MRPRSEASNREGGACPVSRRASSSRSRAPRKCSCSTRARAACARRSASAGWFSAPSTSATSRRTRRQTTSWASSTIVSGAKPTQIAAIAVAAAAPARQRATSFHGPPGRRAGPSAQATTSPGVSARTMRDSRTARSSRRSSRSRSSRAASWRSEISFVGAGSRSQPARVSRPDAVRDPHSSS